MGTCPTGLHSNRHGNCSCGMRKGSGSTRRTEARIPRSYRSQAPKSMRSSGCSSASSRRASGAGCTGMIGLIGLVAVLLGWVARSR